MLAVSSVFPLHALRAHGRIAGNVLLLRHACLYCQIHADRRTRTPHSRLLRVIARALRLNKHFLRLGSNYWRYTRDFLGLSDDKRP